MRFDHRATLHTARGTVALALAQATRFGQRSIGLIGYPRWQSCPARCGLWLPHCRSVHGLGLGAPLQLLYCIDHPRHPQRHLVIATATLHPWRAGLCPGAQHTLELGAGSLPAEVMAAQGLWLEWHP